MEISRRIRLSDMADPVARRGKKKNEPHIAKAQSLREAGRRGEKKTAGVRGNDRLSRVSVWSCR